MELSRRLRYLAPNVITYLGLCFGLLLGRCGVDTARCEGRRCDEQRAGEPARQPPVPSGEQADHGWHQQGADDGGIDEDADAALALGAELRWLGLPDAIYRGDRYTSD